MNKYTWIVMLVALAVPLAYSMSVDLTQLSGETAPDLACSMDFLAGTRTFIANASTMGLGLVCGDNAHILVYECVNNNCNDIVPLEDGYKVNGELPYFDGFVEDDRYFYQCFECPSFSGNCPLVVNEGELVAIDWIGTDPDFEVGPDKELSYTFEGVIGADGLWQTQKGDAGIHYVTATVTDGEFTDNTDLCVEVLKVNNPPQLTVDDTVTVKEGETVNLNPECVDPDGDVTSITFSGWMTEDGKETDFDSEGDYVVRVTCDDTEGASDGVEVVVTVENTNRAPELTVGDDVTVTETETVIVGAVCSDPDGDDTSIEYSGWMTEAQKVTDFGDAGSHVVTVICTDDSGLSAQGEIDVTVLAKNRAPTVSYESEVTFYEGEVVTLSPQCVDADGDATSVSFSGWMESSTKQTDYDDAGVYGVTITCEDSEGLSNSEDVTVNVLNRNRPPKIAWKQKE